MVSKRPSFLVCPACKGALVDRAGSLACSHCGATFAVREGVVDFVEDIEDEFQKKQKVIYEGHLPVEVTVPYASLEVYARSVEALLAEVEKYKILGRSLKALKNKQVIERMALQGGQRVLDIGSGDGALLNALGVLYGIAGVGVDIAWLAVKRCLQVNPCGHEYYVADAHRLPFSDRTFDGVLCFDTLEHTSNPQQVVAEAARVLREGGWMVFYALSKQDQYTWHWTQRALTAGLAGVDETAGHSWEKFIAVDQLIEVMGQSAIGQVKVDHFHSFFTLLLDEHFAHLTTPLTYHPRLAAAFLSLCEWADRPMSSRGFSNGVFVSGRKLKKGRDGYA